MTSANGSRQAVAGDEVTTCELAVLGAVVASADAAGQAVAAKLEPRHFRHPHHAAIYTAALTVAGTPGRVVEPAAVAAELARTGALASADYTPAQFVSALGRYAGDVPGNAALVIAAWHRRTITGTLAEALQAAEGPGWDPAGSPAQIRDLVAAAASLSAPSPLRPHHEILEEFIDALEHEPDPAVSTGFPELDELTGGLAPRTQTVIAARSGVGKTTMALAIADHVASVLGIPVLFSSLEMPRDELIARRVASVAGVPLRRLLRRQMGSREWERVRDAYGYLAGTALVIDDGRDQTMGHIRSRLAEMAQAGTPAGLHILDHLGLVVPSPGERRGDARHLEVAALTNAHRNMAFDLNIPVVTLAQLNRGPEQRKDHRPVVTDLKESGAIEEKADVVMLLWRPEDATGELEVIGAKNRRGPADSVMLEFTGHLARITSPSKGRAWTPTTILGGLRRTNHGDHDNMVCVRVCPARAQGGDARPSVRWCGTGGHRPSVDG